jgi:hypothetical protein
MDVYWKRLDSFGCNAIIVDGHDIEELCKVGHVHVCISGNLPLTLNYGTWDVTERCVHTLTLYLVDSKHY